MPVSSSTEHWIKPDALTINLNHFGDPDYLQVSVLAGAVVMAFKQDVIGYNAAHNYRTWPLEAANTYLETTSAYNVYARLTRSEVNARALVVYDTVLRDIEGREITYAEDGSEVLGDANPDYFFVFLGQISASVNSSGGSVQREWTIDFRAGNLDTNQYRNEESTGEWSKMFRLNKVTDLIEVLKTISSAVINKLIVAKELVLFGKVITDVKRSTDEELSTNDTTIPTTQYLENKFLSKNKDDRSKGTIASDKGIEVGKFQEGTLGSGASTFMRDGSSYSEVDFLKVRKKATFTNISVQELKHVGGEIVLSPAAMVCSRVEEVEEGYKCYFNQTDSDGRKVYNEFEVGDQARCQTFNLENNTYYWRLVTEVGDNYIVLSSSDCDSGSGIPKAGDNISQLGNRNDSDRQAAIILSAYGSDAPSYKQYNGIDSYSLEGKQVTKLSPYGNEITGIVNIESGSTGASNLEDFPDEVFKAVHIGAVNLLLNSGFTGDYKAEELNNGYSLNSESELFSKSLNHWKGIVTVTDDSEAVSGRSVEIGSLSQSVTLIKGENYVISFKAKGSEIAVSCGDFSVAQSLSSDYQRYSYKFVSNGVGDILFSGTAKVCDIQLERGTIATDWNPSPYDNDKSLAEFQAIKYLRDAIVEGDTSIIGGLILSSIIKLGNFKDGKMQKVNAGVSGIYNDDDDVAFWGGGTFEQAISTIMKFKQNPNFRPTEEEWRELANFVVSHGGDLFLRGTIFADNGYFRGELNQGNGATILNKDGSGHLSNGSISWNQHGVMYRKAYDVVLWQKVADYEQGETIDLNQGTYLDLTGSMGMKNVLPNADFDNVPLFLIWKPIGSKADECITLEGNFKLKTLSDDGETFIEATSVKLDAGDREYKLAYKTGLKAWVYEGLGGSVDENGLLTIGSVVSNETEIVTEKVTSNKYFVGNTEGLTQTISIHENGGTSYFTFTSGILTGYRYESHE